MSNQPVQFTLKDAEGNEHEYIVTPHKGTKLIPITITIAQGAAEPLARILDSNFVTLRDAFFSGEGMDLGELLSSIDELNLSAAVKDAFAVLSTAGGTDFVLKMFEFTSRDGSHLSNHRNFDAAYQGNPFEMIQAFNQILKANRFFTFLDSLQTMLGDGNELEESNN